jgi:hypothetical protein
MLGLGLSIPAVAARGRGGGAPAFTPASLFASGEQGAFFDASDLSSMTIARDGTGAAPTVGDPVGRILDRSGRNNHAIAPSDAARPVLRQTAGGLYYLEFDGTDDRMLTVLNAFNIINLHTHVGGWENAVEGRRFYALSGNAGNACPAGIRDTNSGIFYGGNAITTARPSGTFVLTVERTVDEATGWINRASNQTISRAAHDVTNTGIGIGVQGTTATTSLLQGRFYGGLWIGRVLTTQERDNAEDWAASKSGVTL